MTQALDDIPLVGGAGLAGAETPAPPHYDLIELLFFAYRDFVGDADRLLETLRFGRAHHRVLHFVHRNPGLTIAELLDILRITKQSLNRVLKELLDERFVEARTGATDRRQRLLFLTAKGKALALELSVLQSQRFARVLAELPKGAQEAAQQFLLAMIEPEERPRVEALIWRNERTGE
ncbi:MarR family transcriptional regulator [Methylocella sp. CPCC 101449]|jgi:DNA-binding MarR family transcriptional regulator|uniref:MarR family winged helix-turn-helix transcriptional regulator n=1 Tax=Methylocella sp. CPCC 101449 TaxID=2987531 RepID=UPI00288CE42D|nr:MarR family transcriptional regulator [Methylocella sp. CPCC 101449]MDT2023430.1 MarR family transcriptional regulator [Methylocella sp. CPCC 101449]HEV2574032.1 MarR family transcriptional regulator [Beijerinckiaceae bacterium]